MAACAMLGCGGEYVHVDGGRYGVKDAAWRLCPYHAGAFFAAGGGSSKEARHFRACAMNQIQPRWLAVIVRHFFGFSDDCMLRMEGPM